MDYAPLELDRLGGRRGRRRPLSGHDEMLADRPELDCAVELLERLLVRDGTRTGVGSAWALPVSERDRLLADLYQDLFGDRITSLFRCEGCGQEVGIDFALSDLMLSRGSKPADVQGPDPDGTYGLPGGVRFRLPTTADQNAVRGLDGEAAEQALLEGCIVEGSVTDETAQVVQQAMESVGPGPAELESTCAECGTRERIEFDIGPFLLGALMQERPLLYREVHLVATAYRWSPRDILDLTREQRRGYVALILADANHSSGEW